MSRPRLKPQKHKLQKENHFVEYISTNNTNIEYPEVIFLRAKVRITPLLKEKNYIHRINNIKQRFEKYANEVVRNCGIFDKNYILTIEVAEKSVAYNKTSHLRYDLFVKPLKQTGMEECISSLSEISDKFDTKLIAMFKEYSLKWS